MKRNYIDESGQEYPSSKAQGLSKPQHTPTPWEVGLLGYLRGPNNENILEVKANAAYIVRCVNSHEELLEHLKYLAGLVNEDLIPKFMLEIIDKAIAKAEGR